MPAGARRPQVPHEVDDPVELVGLEGQQPLVVAERERCDRVGPDVRANTVSSFALGDYEWLLAFEADDLHRIVDLMRALRSAAARRHTREEVPFYTGRRRELKDILGSW